MLNIQELKAAAYDLIANIEYLQSKLKEINQKIAEQVSKENGPADNSNHI